MPGSAYICKILEFNEKHVESEELYTEFLKGSCEGKDGFLQAPVLVRTVMTVTVTMALFCVMKVKAKVNQMMTVIL